MEAADFKARGAIDDLAAYVSALAFAVEFFAARQLAERDDDAAIMERFRELLVGPARPHYGQTIVDADRLQAMNERMLQHGQHLAAKIEARAASLRQS